MSKLSKFRGNLAKKRASHVTVETNSHWFVAVFFKISHFTPVTGNVDGHTQCSPLNSGKNLLISDEKHKILPGKNYNVVQSRGTLHNQWNFPPISVVIHLQTDTTVQLIKRSNHQTHDTECRSSTKHEKTLTKPRLSWSTNTCRSADLIRPLPLANFRFTPKIGEFHFETESIPSKHDSVKIQTQICICDEPATRKTGR